MSTPGYRTFVDETNGTSIEYPENWTVETGGGFTIARFYPPGEMQENGGASVELTKEHIGSSHHPASLDNLYYLGILESFVMDIRHKSFISPASSTKLAGRPALIMNYSRTLENKTINGTIVYLLKDSWFDYNDSRYDYYMTRYYLIEFSAEAQKFDQYRDDALHMIRSFKLTSSAVPPDLFSKKVPGSGHSAG